MAMDVVHTTPGCESYTTCRRGRWSTACRYSWIQPLNAAHWPDTVGQLWSRNPPSFSWALPITIAPVLSVLCSSSDHWGWASVELHENKPKALVWSWQRPHGVTSAVATVINSTGNAAPPGRARSMLTWLHRNDSGVWLTLLGLYQSHQSCFSGSAISVEEFSIMRLPNNQSFCDRLPSPLSYHSLPTLQSFTFDQCLTQSRQNRLHHAAH